MIKLGDKVKCIVTGFAGIATARIEYLNGCVQFCVKPQMKNKGSMPDGVYIDIQQLKLVKQKQVAFSSTQVGGVMMDQPKR